MYSGSPAKHEPARNNRDVIGFTVFGDRSQRLLPIFSEASQSRQYV
jgi:hypothetical protein